jgi:hypothetical protein
MDVFNEEICTLLKKKMKSSLVSVDNLSIRFSYEGEVSLHDSEEIDRSTFAALICLEHGAFVCGRLRLAPAIRKILDCLVKKGRNNAPGFFEKLHIPAGSSPRARLLRSVKDKKNDLRPDEKAVGDLQFRFSTFSGMRPRNGARINVLN